MTGQTAIFVLIILTDLAGLALGIQLLWGSERARRAGFKHDLLVAAAVGALTAGAGGIVALVMLGSGFAVLRIWTHALFCVLAPLAGARGVQRLCGKGRVVGGLLVLTALAAEGTYIWARRIEPYRLAVTHHEILAPVRQRIRAVVLSDLQAEEIGAYERRVFRTIDELRPDLILIPGDLLQPRRGRAAAVHAGLLELFRTLEPPRLGIFLVDGDVGPRGLDLAEIGARRLRDETVHLPGEPHLRIHGLHLWSSRTPLDPASIAEPEGFDGLTIVLGHAPDYAIPLLDGAADSALLCLAGHTHGGQIVIPGFGPPLTLSRLPRRYAAGGLHRLGKAMICVSRGVGMERGYAPRVRLFCPPELVVLDFVPR